MPVHTGAEMSNGLLRLLRDNKPRTRAELAQLLGLSRSTITSRIDSLRDLGLVGTVASTVPTGGRPSTQIAFMPDARLVLGVDVGAGHVAAVLTNLSGTVLAEHKTLLAVAQGPEVVLSWVVEQALGMVADLGRPIEDLIAVGIGLPGPVEFATGRAVNPPIMPGWHRFDVPGWFQERLAIPTIVDNDVNVSAYGERELAWADTEDLLYVKVSTGIGAGLIMGGQLQRGAQGIAGDIGHVRLAQGGDRECHCGNRGCLEAVASGSALAEDLRGLGRPTESPQDVVELVKAGDLDAVQAIRQAGRDLGEVLAVCVSLINPSLIIIGGTMVQAGEHLLAGIRESLYAQAMPLVSEQLLIMQSRIGESVAARGAAMLAIEWVLDSLVSTGD